MLVIRLVLVPEMFGRVVRARCPVRLVLVLVMFGRVVRVMRVPVVQVPVC